MLRFGVSDPSAARADDALSWPEWPERLRAFEAAGFDTYWVPDHVGIADPFVALTAAAGVTRGMRLGTYVLNVEFWNPLLLARTVATAHAVTGERLVVGLGAGHNRAEFEQAGLRYPPAGERVDRLAATVVALRALAAGETVDDERLGLAGATTGLPPASPPLLVGGNGDRVLDVAGRTADVVGLTGFTAGTGRHHTDLSHWGWDGLADRLARARAAGAAAGRDRLAADILVQRAAVTDDPGAALADFLDEGLAEDQLDSPFLLVGTEDDLVARLARLEGMGVDGVTVFSRDADAFAPVIARHRD